MQAIESRWIEATKEPLSQQSKFVVRMETVWFFAHVVNRAAFAIGGKEASAVTQDLVARPVVTSVVSVLTSGDASNVKPGFDVKAWQRRVLADALDAQIESELDYGNCKTLADSANPLGTLVDETSALGRFGSRVAEAVGQKQNELLCVLVASSALDAMAMVNIPALVKRACRAIE